MWKTFYNLGVEKTFPTMTHNSDVKKRSTNSTTLKKKGAKPRDKILGNYSIKG